MQEELFADRMARAMYSKRCFSEISVLQTKNKILVSSQVKKLEVFAQNLLSRCWSWSLRNSNCPVVVFKPVHVSKAGQYVSRFAKVAILLVVAPQEVHIMNLTLVLFDHMHQMFFQIWRVDLVIGQTEERPAVRRTACNHANSVTVIHTCSVNHVLFTSNLIHENHM